MDVRLLSEVATTVSQLGGNRGPQQILLKLTGRRRSKEVHRGLPCGWSEGVADITP